MKKLFIVLTMLIVLVTGTFSYSTTEEVAEVQAEETTENVSPAAEKVLNDISKKDKKIAEYTDKYNNKAYGTTAYYLEVFQLYIIPICVIGIAIGAFNCFIIGEKKLDKRERGFSIMMGFLWALVIFQVLPFIFALLVAGK